MTIVGWLLVAIAYNGTVRQVAVYPTPDRTLCELEKMQERTVWFDIRDHLCVPIIRVDRPSS